MANYNKSISSSVIRLGEVRFSYAYVSTPRRNEDGTPGKYSCQILLPKKDAQAKDLFTSALNNALNTGIANGKLLDKNGKKLPDIKIHTPMRDGDEEYPDDPNYAGMWFFNASSQTKPGVAVWEDGKARTLSDMDSDEFYSGCYGAVTVSLYPYAVSGNAGIAVGLNNVIKTRDGERLAGGHSAEQDFADLEVEGGSFLD